MSLIDLKDIDKIYRVGDTEIPALRNINLSIGHGELIAIIGASGSGKSTLLNILGFLDVPSHGVYHLDGKTIPDMSDNELSSLRNMEIGFIFQSFFLLSRLTAKQNVMLPLFYRDTRLALSEERAKSLLDYFEVGQLCDHFPNQMSGGQQQRVALARALVGDPSIILADEPTGSLDSKTSTLVMDQLIQLNERDHKTVVVVTHDLEVANRCRRIIHIQDGRVTDDKVGGV